MLDDFGWYWMILDSKSPYNHQQNMAFEHCSLGRWTTEVVQGTFRPLISARWCCPMMFSKGMIQLFDANFTQLDQPQQKHRWWNARQCSSNSWEIQTYRWCWLGQTPRMLQEWGAWTSTAIRFRFRSLTQNPLCFESGWHWKSHFQQMCLNMDHKLISTDSIRRFNMMQPSLWYSS